MNKRSMSFVLALGLIFIILSLTFNAFVFADIPTPDYPDISWEYIGGENRLGEMIYAQDKYVTVGYDGIKVSHDLENWKTVVDLKNEEQYIYGGWSAIEYGGGIFVVTGLSGGIYTSIDGEEWSFYERPFDFDISEIIWDGNQFVAVGQYGRDEFQEDKRPAGIIVSSNGLDWKKHDVNFDMPWGLEHIAYNGNVYVVDGISEIFYSYDLMKWEQCDIFNGYNEGIEWVKDRFIATRGYNNIMYSFDGINWKSIEQSWDNTMWACAYNGNIFVAVGSDATIYVSYDGMNWICKTEWGKTDNGLCDIIWTGDRFVILGSKSNLTWMPDDIIKVALNSEYIQFDQAPVIVDGRTLVPIRAVCEKLGADVYWLDMGEIVIIVKNDTKIFLKIGEKDMHIMQISAFSEFENNYNGQDEGIILDVPPQIIGDRTLLPIRAVCEALGATVDWNGETNTVVITCSEEIMNDKNRDTTFFDSLTAFIEAQIEEQKESLKVEYGDFDYTAIIKISCSSDFDEYVAAREFIQAKVDSLGITPYTLDLSEENLITIRFGYNEGFDIDEFIDNLMKESNLYFVDADDNIILDKTNIIDAKSVWNGQTQCYDVEISLTEDGRAKFAAATETMVGKIISIRLDDIIITSPTVMDKIDSDKVVITGNFNSATASSLAHLIKTKGIPKNMMLDSTAIIENIF